MPSCRAKHFCISSTEHTSSSFSRMYLLSLGGCYVMCPEQPLHLLVCKHVIIINHDERKWLGLYSSFVLPLTSLCWQLQSLHTQWNGYGSSRQYLDFVGGLSCQCQSTLSRAVKRGQTYSMYGNTSVYVEKDTAGGRSEANSQFNGKGCQLRSNVRCVRCASSTCVEPNQFKFLPT